MDDTGSALIEQGIQNSTHAELATMVRAQRLTNKAHEAEIEQLRKLVHVPGIWRCAKCNFRLTQSNLNMGDGTVTARDEPGTHCPNDGSPMWRVSYADWAREMSDAVDKYFAEASNGRALITAAVAAINRLLPHNLAAVPGQQFDDDFVVPVDMTMGEIRQARDFLAAELASRHV